MLLFNLLVIASLLFLNGFFVAAEFALVGVRKTRIQQLANEGNFNAKLALDAVKNIDRYIAAVQLGITIASLGIGWVGESTLATLIHPLFSFLPGKLDTIAAHTVSVSAAFAMITVLHVVIGELMPKSIALQYPEKTTLWVAKPMFVITKVFAPLIFLLNGLGNFLLRLCRIEPANSHHMVHTTEELNMLIDASCKGGVLNEKEAEILQNVFKFSDLTAAQVMVPRTDMVCVAKDISIEELRKNEYNLNLSRYAAGDLRFENGVPFESVIKRISRGAPCTAKQLDEMVSDCVTNMQYLMLANIRDGVIDDKLPYLSYIDQKYEKYCLKNNSLILSKNGLPYKVAVASVQKNQKILANGNLYIIELDEKKANPYYIKAFFDSEQGYTVLKSITVGAVLPNIGVDKLKKVEIPLPPIEEQNRIAEKYRATMDEIAVIKLHLEKAVNKLHHIFDEESE